MSLWNYFNIDPYSLKLSDNQKFVLQTTVFMQEKRYDF